jgi:hypothetical protein
MHARKIISHLPQVKTPGNGLTSTSRCYNLARMIMVNKLQCPRMTPTSHRCWLTHRPLYLRYRWHSYHRLRKHFIWLLWYLLPWHLLQSLWKAVRDLVLIFTSCIQPAHLTLLGELGLHKVSVASTCDIRDHTNIGAPRLQIRRWWWLSRVWPDRI